MIIDLWCFTYWEVHKGKVEIFFLSFFLYCLSLMNLVIEDMPLTAMAHPGILKIHLRFRSKNRVSRTVITYQADRPNHRVVQDLSLAEIRVLHRGILEENY